MVLNTNRKNRFCIIKTFVEYGVEALNLDENIIKIDELMYKYTYLAYVVCSNGCWYREWRNRTNIVLSLNLNTTKSYSL